MPAHPSVLRCRRPVALALASAALLLAVAASAPAEAPAAYVDRVERRTVALINAHRRRAGKPALRISARLTTGATRHSRAMARRGVIAHGAWYGRVSRYAGTRTVGEVLAYVRRPSRYQARSVVRAWLRSSSHRAVILSGRFRRVGIGRRWRRPGGTTYFTLDAAR